jgi:hypothetical protein
MPNADWYKRIKQVCAEDVLPCIPERQGETCRGLYHATLKVFMPGHHFPPHGSAQDMGHVAHGRLRDDRAAGFGHTYPGRPSVRNPRTG